MKLHYHRTHLPSGGTYVDEFHPSHHPVFCDPKGYNERTVVRAAEETISHWNRQQPFTWRYRIATEEEVAAHSQQPAA